MLDINFIKENIELVKKAVENKKCKDVNIDELLELNKQKNKFQSEIDILRQKRNELSSGNEKPSQEKIEKVKKIKEMIVELEKGFPSITNERYEELLLSVPNVTDPNMPVGKDEDENVVIKKWGKITEFNFEIKDHVELGKSLDIIDVDKSAEISGSRFFYLKNEAALMQFAIIQLVFETLSNPKIIKGLAKKVGNTSFKTFIPILPPVMIKPSIMKKMDRLDPIEDRYELKRDELIMIGSAEHTLGPIHMNEVLKKEDLPIRYIGYSSAFRREAGSYGKDVKGILRTHQFEKLEMESFTSADTGESEQKLIVAIQEYLVRQLEIPYQLVQICTGDTGKPDYNQFDIECWIPSQKKYRETHTSDYMTDYQARRLNTQYIDEKGEKKYVHMNDATAFAIGRILVAIIENNQTEKGTVKIPKVLQKYVGTKEILPK